MAQNRRNVILITVDSLRADHVGVYDESAEGLTPNLDDFSRDGLLFENAIAQGSYTRASIPSFFTSTYPGKLNGGGDISDRETLATVLKSQGYSTAFYHSNPFLSSALGYDRGFDIFDDSLLPWNLNLSQRRIRQLGRVFRLLRRTPYLPADKLVDKAVKWLKGAEPPFFLWVHFMDPHGPYQGRGSGYRGKYRAEKLWNKAVNNPEDITVAERERLIDTYREEVNFTDENIGRLLDSLEKKKGKNLTCITADHGEEFGEHGDFSHNPKPFEELIHVPFLMKVPGYDGRRICDPVELLDIFPTVLDLVDLDPEQYDLDGRSLVDLFEGEVDAIREYVVSQPGPEEICLRSNSWKYVVKCSEEVLYDLSNDSGETEDRSEIERKVVEEFRRELTRKEDELGSHLGVFAEIGDSGEDEETRKRLEDLGYL